MNGARNARRPLLFAAGTALCIVGGSLPAEASPASDPPARYYGNMPFSVDVEKGLPPIPRLPPFRRVPPTRLVPPRTVSDSRPSNGLIALADRVAGPISAEFTGAQIFVLNPDGTGGRQLTTEGTNILPAWAPDGETLAFVSLRAGFPEIWLMNADGSNQRRLRSGGDALVPAWSPEGRRLAFVSGRTGSPQIWAVNLDGSGLAQLTTGRTQQRSRLVPRRAAHRLLVRKRARVRSDLGHGCRRIEPAAAHQRAGARLER